MPFDVYILSEHSTIFNEPCSWRSSAENDKAIRENQIVGEQCDLISERLR